LHLAENPGDTALSAREARFCFTVLALKQCRRPGVRRKTLPLPVILKRLAIDFFVFCMRIYKKATLPAFVKPFKV
tara:strand:+ start:12449 stop:12673 length:225 start_codon:yes stop_codon:yes gene_type:complete